MSETQTSQVLSVFLTLAKATQGAAPDAIAADLDYCAGHVSAALAILSDLNLVEMDPQFSGRYRLGDRAADLGKAGRYVQMRHIAWPYLRATHQATGRRVSLHILQGHWQRAIDECPRRSPQELSAAPELSYRDGRILRFGSTALVMLANLPRAEAEATLAKTAHPPSIEEVATHPQWGHLKGVPMNQAAWDAATPTWDELAAIRDCGYAVSAPGGRSSMGGLAITAPVFERGQITAGLCVFGPLPAGREDEDDIPILMTEAANISSALDAV